MLAVSQTSGQPSSEVLARACFPLSSADPTASTAAAAVAALCPGQEAVVAVATATAGCSPGPFHSMAPEARAHQPTGLAEVSRTVT